VTERTATLSQQQVDEWPTETIHLQVWYDFLCPFAHSASVWLRDCEEALGDKIQIEWKAFPLEQVNADLGPEWKLWEQADDYDSKGLLGFRAAVAARQQGDPAFRRMLHALMAVRHVDKRTLTRWATMLHLAEREGLDVARFERDLSDRDLLPTIGAEYQEGRERFGVFGTPTLVLPGGEAVYVQMLPAPPKDEAVAALREVLHVATDRPYLREIKRPHLPG
jgi:predicted DsbA family dithiol-disulfide isomerase